MLASCAVDKTVTIWDTYNKAENVTSEPPRACGNKEMGVGKLYSINFYPSTPWLLGCAGGGKELALWDMTRDESIQKRFGDRAGGELAKPEPETADETSKKEAFDAMMAAPTQNKVENGESSKSTMNEKKTGHKKKKKVHRAGR
jgi:WD40 repeat protein